MPAVPQDPAAVCYRTRAERRVRRGSGRNQLRGRELRTAARNSFRMTQRPTTISGDQGIKATTTRASDLPIRSNDPTESLNVRPADVPKVGADSGTYFLSSRMTMSIVVIADRRDSVSRRAW